MGKLIPFGHPTYWRLHLAVNFEKGVIVGDVPLYGGEVSHPIPFPKPLDDHVVGIEVCPQADVIKKTMLQASHHRLKIMLAKSQAFNGQTPFAIEFQFDLLIAHHQPVSFFVHFDMEVLG